MSNLELLKYLNECGIISIEGITKDSIMIYDSDGWNTITLYIDNEGNVKDD